MLKDILACIVCGMEHSGTTIMMRLLCQDKRLGGGLECHALRPNKFTDFKYKKYAKIFKQCWQVSGIDFRRLTDSNSKSYEDFFRDLRVCSGIIKDKSVRLVDKTPFYFYDLDKLFDRVGDVPVIVMRKDPRNMISSLTRRRVMLKRAIKLYKEYYEEKLPSLIEKYKGRLQVIQWEWLLKNPEKVLRKVFKFIGLKFDSETYKEVLSCGMIKTFLIDVYKTRMSPDNLEKVIEQIDPKCFLKGI